jgi:hypothetical protein
VRLAAQAHRYTLNVPPKRKQYLTEPLVLGPADSGEAGRFRVVWSTPTRGGAVHDGGVAVTVREHANTKFHACRPCACVV